VVVLRQVQKKNAIDKHCCIFLNSHKIAQLEGVNAEETESSACASPLELLKLSYRLAVVVDHYVC